MTYDLGTAQRGSHTPAGAPRPRLMADVGLDEPPRGVPGRRAPALWRPGHDPDLLDRGADGAVQRARCRARGLRAAGGDRPRGAELGVRAPVRRSLLDPGHRRRWAPARTPPAPEAVSRRADARAGADDRRPGARRAQHLARALQRA